MRLPLWKLVGLPCLVLLLFTLPHLDQGDFRRDSGKYAAVGHYLWSGASWWQPSLGPETPYFNKPPLALWVHGAFLKILGVNLVAARLPSILAALGILSLSVLTVRLWSTRAEALTSGMILALTYEFFRRTREISLDQWQLLFVMAAVYLFARAVRRQNRSGLPWAGLPLGLALLCKPLVALGTLPIFVVWLLCVRRKDWVWLVPGTILPVALLVALPWHLAMWNHFGNAFTQQYFGHEILDRAAGQLSRNPPLFFLDLLARTYWPWALAVVFAVWKRFFSGSPHRRAGRDLVVLGGSWCLLVLIFISVFPDKKVNYALPLYPMLSWVAAAGVCRVPWRALRRYYARGLPWLAPVATAALVLVSLLPIQFQEPPKGDWPRLLAWLKQQAISPQSLVSADLSHGDLAYFYLKTGHWLPAEPPGATAALEALVLTRAAQAVSREPVFQAGGLAIVKAASSPPSLTGPDTQ